MGVGVFRDTFHGTGSTINVSGPLFGDDGYEAYLEEVGEDDAISRETWEQDQYDQFNSDLVEVVRQVGDELDMTRSDSSEFSTSERAGFDKDFCLIASGDLIGLGWRSWEHDFVVGIGSDAEWAQDGDLEEWRESLVLRYHLPAQVVTNSCAEMSTAAALYTRLRLQQAGFDCRYPTSGYTSSAYDAPEDFEEAIAKAKSAYLEASNRLAVPADGSANRTAHNEGLRVALLEDLIRVSEYNGRTWDRQDIRPITMLYDIAADHIVVIHPLDNDVEPIRSGISVEDDVVAAHLRELGEASEHDLVPLRFTDAVVKPWLDAWLKTTPNPHWQPAEILVDVDDVLAATKGEHEVDLDWSTDEAPAP